MSNFGQGILTEYKIDKDYFKEGDAYRLKINGHGYVNAICTRVRDKQVEFGFHNAKVEPVQQEEFMVIKITIDELMYNNSYDIIRLKADYNNGKFGE